ncbi:MAG: hypothetical protein ABIR32_22900 [Ilumatobacteraceae bacterium]
MNHRLNRRALVAACALLAVSPLPAAAAPVRPAPSGSLATFEGHQIDLAQGWGEATACAVTDTGTTCYRSEAEMDAATKTPTPATSTAEASATASACSSSLRLYDGTSFTGTVLSVSTRGSLLTLSTYGFDNKTSSYKVAACAAILYSGIQSGTYPGNTAANAQAASMQSGWDNVISSVLIP